MRNPFESQVWRNAAFARVWTPIGLRATAWLAPLGGLAGAAILWASPVRTLRTVIAPPPEAGLGGPGVLAEAAAVVVEVERDQPVGG